MSVIKINKLAKLIEIFDEMSKDLYFGWLSNSEKDVLLKLSKQYSIDKNSGINIKQVTFTDFEGKTIVKSTLYKVLKTLCEKNLISHLGSECSSVYKIN